MKKERKEGRRETKKEEEGKRRRRTWSSFVPQLLEEVGAVPKICS